VQQRLDGFRAYWNNHCIRAQKEKKLPSGHIPSLLAQDPSSWGGLDCRITVPRHVVDRLRQLVTEDVGPREDHLTWCSHEFQAQADNAHAALGYPDITLENAWDVFQDMLEVLNGQDA
jgi:hypothetical protein